VIPVTPHPEPPDFDENCRSKGRRWLTQHPGYKDRPADFWSPFEPQVRTMFRDLCGWSAMTLSRGQIDHFFPVAEAKKTNQDHLAYEWSNFRYSDGWINQKKLSATVLDPFLVGAGWFRILIPSLQLVATEKIPAQYREVAQFTLKRLGLTDSEVIVRYRDVWFQLYRRRRLDLEGLREVAPLIAEAVERDLGNGKDHRIVQQP